MSQTFSNDKGPSVIVSSDEVDVFGFEDGVISVYTIVSSDIISSGKSSESFFKTTRLSSVCSLYLSDKEQRIFILPRFPGNQ